MLKALALLACAVSVSARIRGNKSESSEGTQRKLISAAGKSPFDLPNFDPKWLKPEPAGRRLESCAATCFDDTCDEYVSNGACRKRAQGCRELGLGGGSQAGQASVCVCMAGSTHTWDTLSTPLGHHTSPPRHPAFTPQPASLTRHVVRIYGIVGL